MAHLADKGVISWEVTHSVAGPASKKTSAFGAFQAQVGDQVMTLHYSSVPGHTRQPRQYASILMTLLYSIITV